MQLAVVEHERTTSKAKLEEKRVSRKRKCGLCASNEHDFSTCTKCRLCKNHGHWAQDCPETHAEGGLKREERRAGEGRASDRHSASYEKGK